MLDQEKQLLETLNGKMIDITLSEGVDTRLRRLATQGLIAKDELALFTKLMKDLDDGRYNKVANIVGHTMQYHPHGDASIADAMVQIGQKDLLIDTQGNWGNILTGDRAAASRYIEARLSKFALDVIFNPKVTNWQSSYDGRRKEPINLPVKFPLLLAQGAEGIAVGLSTKILSHNFNELIDASIKYLKNKRFTLYPDFITGGIATPVAWIDYFMCYNAQTKRKLSEWEFFPSA